MMRSAGGWIYAARKADSTLIKIGCTKRTVGQRLQGLTRHYHAAIVLCGAVCVDQGAVRVDQAVHHIERRVHVLLAADCVEGEWFAITITQERLETLVTQAACDVGAAFQQQCARLYEREQLRRRSLRNHYLKYKSKRMQEWVAPLLAELDESHRQPALAS